ncbi:MAG: carboxypeptidase regulatory-like domain-containing protein [Planctomycetota bacterium]
MKSWPLILVVLLLGVCAWIVLAPTEQTSIDTSSGFTEEVSPASTLSDAVASSSRDFNAADALARTEVTSGPAEASLNPSAENTLPFTRAAGSLKLKLVDGDGKGIQDAKVRIHLGGSGPGIDVKEWQNHNLLATGLDGILQVDVPSHVDLMLNIEGSQWHEVSRQIQAIAVGEEVDLGEIALAPANHLYGQVKGPEGQAIAHAFITLQEANGSMWGNFGQKQTRSDESGHYSLDGVRRGRYEFEVKAQGFAPMKLDAQEVDQSKGEFELDLELTYGDSTRGQVVDEEGTPIPNAHVYLVAVDANNYWRENHPALPKEDSQILSDADGRFSIQGLSDDTSLHIGARAEGYGVGFADEVKANGDALVRLTQHFALRGTVVDKQGNPVEHASISLVPSDPGEDDNRNISTQSKEDGSFELKPQAPGSWNLSLTSALGNIEQQTVQLGPDTEALALILPLQNPLNIRVVDSAGKALAGVKVWLKKPENQKNLESALTSLGYSGSVSFSFKLSGQFDNHSTTQTDENGVAHFADLPPEKYKLRLNLLGYAQLEKDFDVTGVAQEDEFTLESSAFLRVRLVNSNGESVSNVQVGLRTTETGDDLEQKRTDDAGRAVWNNLEEGDYQVSYRANDADGWWWDQDEDGDRSPDQAVVSVKAGETKDFELIINDLALLTVRVTRHGIPASDVKVQLQEVKKNNRRRFGNNDDHGRPTDGRGSIILPAVKAGKYDIVIKGRKSSPATKERVELYVGPQTIEVELDGSEVRGSLMGTAGPLVGATVALVPYVDPNASGKNRRRNSISIISYSITGENPVIKFGKSGEQDTNTRSSSQGSYVFLDVPDGQWTIIARADGYGTWTSQPIAVQGGQSVDLGSYRLFPGGIITGHDYNWTPPSQEEEEERFWGWGSSLRLEDGKGEMLSMANLDERGDFSFQDLPEGIYVLIADQFTSEKIHISAGERVSHDIPLEQPKEDEKPKQEQ